MVNATVLGGLPPGTALVLYICRSTYVTGVELTIDGGAVHLASVRAALTRQP